MQITYNIGSHKYEEATENTTDNIRHATTGDGWIAYSLFYDMMQDHPDRVFTIEAYVDLEEGRDAEFVKETDEGMIALLAYVRGSAEEKDLDILTTDYDMDALSEAMVSMGLQISPTE